jgi:hypothetical protein
MIEPIRRLWKRGRVKTKSFVIAGLVLVSGYGIGRAQSSNKNTIDFGNKVLRLGMAEDAVIAALAENYSVDEMGFVTTKSGPPYESAGQLVFKNGRLVGVWKDWSPNNQQQGYELANNIYGLFKALEDEGRTNCILSTGSKQTATSEQKTAFLLCGGKEIQISNLRLRKDDETNEFAVLTEILKAKD